MMHSATRALALLRAMNLRSVSSVRDLAGDTGISKPSVVRLLAILIEDGYVQRASKAGSYMLTENVLQLSSGFRRDTALESAAGLPMEQLTKSIGWPAALGMFEQGMMMVRYSTIPTSPLSWYRTTLHQRLPLLHSAMGLVFLAFSNTKTRHSLLSLEPADELGEFVRSEERFGQIRERGYAIRIPTTEHPTFSLSVPLLAGDQVVAALSVTLFGRAMSADQAVERYLEKVRGTAEAILARSAKPVP